MPHILDIETQGRVCVCVLQKNSGKCISKMVKSRFNTCKELSNTKNKDTTRQEKLTFSSSGERPVNVECATAILFYHSLKVAFQGKTQTE